MACGSDLHDFGTSGDYRPKTAIPIVRSMDAVSDPPPFERDAALDALKAAPDCIKVLSATGRVLFINDHGLKLLEAASADQIIGKSYPELWPSAMQAPIRKALADAVAGQPTHVEGLRFTLKGRIRWWEVNFHGMHGKSREREIICIARDLTERRDREIELQAAQTRLINDLAQAEQRRTEFIATLAHELRNPLAPVRSGLQILRNAADDAAAVSRVREIMERQVGQMVHLINDLLDIARVTSGKLELQVKRVNLGDIIASAVESTAPAMAKFHHHVSVDMPPAPITLFADGTRLAQVFSNLLDNAAKYTPAGGQITVQVRCSAHGVVVSFIDSGIGLAPEALQPIFDMFTHVGRDANGLQQGLGIGLNLVRRLVEMHGGEVTASSDGLGKGSEFQVALPLDLDQGEVGDIPSVRPTRPVQPIRVLIVDDNVDAASTLSMLLQSEHHRIETAFSGQQGLEMVADFKPDIVFLDIGMPQMNGYEVARAIRSMPEAGNPLLVALTGWGGESDRRRSREAGINEHLTKPADLSVIQATLDRLTHSMDTRGAEP